jgi:hypothetical protein
VSAILRCGIAAGIKRGGGAKETGGGTAGVHFEPILNIHVGGIAWESLKVILDAAITCTLVVIVAAQQHRGAQGSRLFLIVGRCVVRSVWQNDSALRSV